MECYTLVRFNQIGQVKGEEAEEAVPGPPGWLLCKGANFPTLEKKCKLQKTMMNEDQITHLREVEDIY